MTRTRLVLAGIGLVVILAPSSPATAQSGINLGEGFDATGEVGLRYEVDTEQPGSEETDHRFRLHASLGGRFRATDSITLVTRLRATGEGDPRDSHVELGSGLQPLAIAFDRAFVRLQRRGLVANLGLVDHATKSSSILWDRDLSPAGGSVSYGRRLRSVTLAPTAFAYLVRGDVGARPAAIYGGELSAQTLIADADIEVAGGTFRLARKNALADSSAGNLTDAEGNLASDFEIIEGRIRIKLYQLLWFPIELSGDVFINPGADEDKNAFAAGIGSTQRRAGGMLTVGYRFRSIERDAVVAALSTDDFRLATNVVGHDITLGFDFEERVKLTVSLFAFQDKDGDLEATPDVDEGQLQLRTRADLSVRF